jgi:Subtilase family
MSPLAATVRLAGAAIAAGTFAVALGAPAVGSELPFPSQQRQSDRGAPLPFASAPTRPAGLCIIDSGLTLNPDLEPVVVDREALDGGDPGDVDPGLHGTRMAMEAAAVPGNGWGMVGAAPGAVRIVSIRATNTADGLSFNAYKQGMLLCEIRAATYNIKVISLSVGFQGTPPPEQLSQLEDAVTEARSTYGLDVVAAAGNEGASQVSYPAAAPGVLAVGASNAQREPCAFSNTGPQLALLAPGCDLEEANPLTGTVEYNEAGTSFSEADDAAVLAALRAYRPDLGPEQAEQLMRSTAAAAGGVLDVSALFRAAGLGGVIADGEAHEPKPQLTPAPTQARSPATTPTAKRRAHLVKPRVRIRRRGKILTVRLLNLPRGDRLAASLLGPRHHTHRHLLRRISTIRRTISLPVIHAGLLVLSYTDPAGRAVSSQASYPLR